MQLNLIDGTFAQRLSYDAFGNVLQNTSPGFQCFGFAGGLYDEDTKLVRFGARDYDAEIGRWTDKEPLGFAGDINFFVYCDNDPINNIDPSGLITLNDIRDFSASVSSALSLGLSDYVLAAFGEYGYYNKCSDASDYGNWAGTAIGIVAGGKGLLNLAKSGLKSGRVFWSGGEVAKNAAKAWAKKNGGKTIEMTFSGKLLDLVTNKYTYKYLKPIWQFASRRFASGASGTVNVFQNAKGIALSSTWATVEYPILKNTVKILYHVVP